MGGVIQLHAPRVVYPAISPISISGAGAGSYKLFASTIQIDGESTSQIEAIKEGPGVVLELRAIFQSIKTSNHPRIPPTILSSTTHLCLRLINFFDSLNHRRWPTLRWLMPILALHLSRARRWSKARNQALPKRAAIARNDLRLRK